MQSHPHPRTVRPPPKSVWRHVDIPRAKKRRQPTTDTESTLVLSSSAPSLRAAVAASPASHSSSPIGEQPVMATVCAVVAATPLNSASSHTSSALSSPPLLGPPVSAVVLSAPPERWMNGGSKRSKTPVLASPWSGRSHDSFGDWMAQHDGASPASSTSASTASSQPIPSTHTHMHRRSSLPCFPFPTSNFPGSPVSGNSQSTSSLPSFPPMPAEPSRLQSAPSATRELSGDMPRLESAAVSSVAPSDSIDEAAAAAGVANRFEFLQLRLAAHPAIRQLQQLEEARGDEQVNVNEESEEEEEEEEEELDEDDDENEMTTTVKEEMLQQPFQYHQSREDEQDNAYQLSAPHPPQLRAAGMLSCLPVVDEAEHGPLAGLVTAFPFVQQFIPQPSRAEKKKQFIQRIHASHQLTIHNEYPQPTTTGRSILPQANVHTSQFVSDDCLSPELPIAITRPFRTVSSSPTVESDDSHEEVSSEHDSCSTADCSSSALADTFASLSPHFAAARSTAGFTFPSPAQPAPFFLSPTLSSSAPSLPALHSPALSLPPVFSSPAMLSAGGSSLCPDDWQLDERAWDEGGHWMGDW